MKKILLFILGVFFSLFLFARGNAAESLSINGYDWEKLSMGSKTLFVEGWAMCGKSAVDNLVIDFNKWNESVEFMKLQEKSFKDAGVILSGVTIGQLTDIIDKIYSDPRVKNMDIIEVMPLVSGRLIQGWTEKELDEIIAINVRLVQCQAKEKKLGQVIEECSSARKERNSFFQKFQKR
jgi:hypothetical protein